MLKVTLGLYTLAVMVLVLVGRRLILKTVESFNTYLRCGGGRSESSDDAVPSGSDDTRPPAQGGLRFRGAMEQRGERHQGNDQLDLVGGEDDGGDSPAFSPASPVVLGEDDNGNRRAPPFNVFGPQPEPEPEVVDVVRQGPEIVEVLPPPVVVFLAPRTGRKYHVRSRCHGLLSATAVRSAVLCRGCLEGQIQDQDLFCVAGGLVNMQKLRRGVRRATSRSMEGAGGAWSRRKGLERF